jgi:hypothetical protein
MYIQIHERRSTCCVALSGRKITFEVSKSRMAGSAGLSPGAASAAAPSRRDICPLARTSDGDCSPRPIIEAFLQAPLSKRED